MQWWVTGASLLLISGLTLITFPIQLSPFTSAKVHVTSRTVSTAGFSSDR